MGASAFSPRAVWLASALVFAWCMTLRAEDAKSGITIIDEQGKQTALEPADLAKLKRQKAVAVGRDGKPVEFEGAPLSEVLQKAGVVLGKELKGDRAACVAVIRARDGYETAFSLLELDAATTDKVVLLTDRRAGAALGEKEGPWRIVVPDEKRQVRWVRMVATIQVKNLKETAKASAEPRK